MEGGGIVYDPQPRWEDRFLIQQITPLIYHLVRLRGAEGWLDVNCHNPTLLAFV